MKPWIYVLIIGVLLLAMGAVIGYQFKKCPPISTNIVHIYDTVWKEIPVVKNHYLIKLDTIVYEVEIPAQVDTQLILKSYFSKYVYTREWKDSLLYAVQTDTVTQNKIFPQSFSYKILRPQTIITNTIDNSITYNRYLTAGASLLLTDPKYFSIDVTYQWEKGYIGGQWYPGVKGYGIRAGVPLFKFRKTFRK